MRLYYRTPPLPALPPPPRPAPRNASRRALKLKALVLGPARGNGLALELVVVEEEEEEGGAVGCLIVVEEEARGSVWELEERLEGKGES